MLGELAEALVERAAEQGDLAGVFRDGFLTPAIGNRAQQGDERGRCGEDDTLIDAALDETGVALEGGGEAEPIQSRRSN